MNSTINERIEQIMNYEKLNYLSFGKKISFSDVVVGNIVKGRNKPSFDFIEKISQTFDWINIDWLITGTGEMLKKSEDGAGIGADGRGDGGEGCELCKQKDEKIAELQALLEKAEEREERLFDTIAHLQNMCNYPVANKKTG